MTVFLNDPRFEGECWNGMTEMDWFIIFWIELLMFVMLIINYNNVISYIFVIDKLSNCNDSLFC
jgi:hypothetical protein